MKDVYVENPYKELGIPDGSEVSVAKKAYRKLCMKYHPDISGAEMGSADYEKFLRIQQSWELIRDSQVTIVNGRYYSQKWGNIRKGYSTVGNKSRTYWHHDSLFTISKRSR